ncbi:phospholipid scramblase 2-like [Haemaphysalis longicornis]
MHLLNQTTKPDHKFAVYTVHANVDHKPDQWPVEKPPGPVRASGQGPVVRTATSPANGHEQGHTAGHGHPTPPVEKEAEKRRKLFIGLPLQRPVPHLLPDVAPVLGCPPGLEYLCDVNQVLVNQMIDLKKWYGLPKRYVVKNTMDQFIFLAIEESDCRDRWFYCGGRPFDMRLLDYRNVPVLRFIRPLRCDRAWCFCCLQELEVQAPEGTVIGSVRMDFSLSPSFSILDRSEKLVLKIKRPLCPSTFCCNDVLFRIFAADEVTKLGHVIKFNSGLSGEEFIDVDSFSLAFPIDLDVKRKAVLLGALIIIVHLAAEVEVEAEVVAEVVDAVEVEAEVVDAGRHGDGRWCCITFCDY